MGKLKKAVAGNWNFFYILVVPLIFLFVPFLGVGPLKPGQVSSYESRCLYMVIVMALFWLVNALPLVVTALIPVAIVPLFGIATAKEVSNNYMKEPTMMAFGSFMIGCAFLISDLHKRLALFLMKLTGNSITRIVTAIFVSTVLLSMFMTNIAATLVMVATAAIFVDERESIEDLPERNVEPHVYSRLHSTSKIEETQPTSPSKELKAQKQKSSKKFDEVSNGPSNPNVEQTAEQQMKGSDEGGDVKGEEEEGEEEAEAPQEKPLQPKAEKTVTLNLMARQDFGRKLKKQLYITVYVAANIGGLFLPYSSPISDTFYIWTDSRKNVLTMGKNQTKGSFDLAFWKNGQKEYLTLGKWVKYMLPIMLVLGGTAWVYLQIVFTWFSPAVPNQKSIISKKDQFEITILRLEQDVYGNKYKKLGRLTFHQAVILTLTTVLFFFLILRDPRSFDGWSRNVPNKQGDKHKQVKAGNSVGTILIVFLMFMIPRLADVKVSQAILAWKFVEAQVLWNIVILLGGSFALSQAIHESGLSIIPLRYFNTLAKENLFTQLEVALIFMSWACGKIISGLASVNIFVQVFALLSRYHPKIGYACMPITAICELGFMVPMATPTNAIVFTAAAADLRIVDMIKYGAFLEIVSLAVVTAAHFAYGDIFYDKAENFT